MSTFKARPSPRRPRKADQSQLFGSKVFESPRTRRVRGQARGRQPNGHGFEGHGYNEDDDHEDHDDHDHDDYEGNDDLYYSQREQRFDFDRTDEMSGGNEDYGIHTPENSKDGLHAHNDRHEGGERDDQEHDNDVGLVESLVSDMNLEPSSERVAMVADAVSDMIIEVIKMHEKGSA